MTPLPSARPSLPRVLLVGAGGLGCAAAPVLARAPRPIEIVVLDPDTVEPGNLHRQVLHGGAAPGSPKAPSLARFIERERAHPDTRATPIVGRLDQATARDLVRGAALVLDGSDNFPTRFRANDACVIEGVPLVHAAAIRWQGQLLAVDPRRGGPCYRCLFEAPPPPGEGLSCDEAGVCGPVVGVVGALAAELALDLLGLPLPGEATRAAPRDASVGRLLVFDGLAASGGFRTVRFRRNPRCPACGDGPRLADLLGPGDYEVPAC